MPMPPETRRRLLERFDDLIRRGDAFKAEVTWETLDAGSSWAFPSGNPYPSEPCRAVRMDWAGLDQWRTSCVMFLERVLPERSSLLEALTKMRKADTGEDLWIWLKGQLRAIREEIDHGLLDELSDEIEAEIAANYMGQAELLLGDAAATTKAFVPAAVLAGAVLERYLRELCAKQVPPIPTTGPNGKPKTLDPLIADLTKAGAMNATRATLLRGWAAIRNRAAHGEWDQFTREEVEDMVRGVQRVVAGM